MYQISLKKRIKIKEWKLDGIRENIKNLSWLIDSVVLQFQHSDSPWNCYKLAFEIISKNKI